MVPVGLNWPGGPGGPELQLTDFAASWLKHNGLKLILKLHIFLMPTHCHKTFPVVRK